MVKNYKKKSKYWDSCVSDNVKREIQSQRGIKTQVELSKIYNLSQQYISKIMNEKLYYYTKFTMTSLDSDDLETFSWYLKDTKKAGFILIDIKWDITTSMTSSCWLELGFINIDDAILVKLKFDGYDWQKWHDNQLTSYDQL